jgi:hypothetical protein
MLGKCEREINLHCVVQYFSGFSVQDSNEFEASDFKGEIVEMKVKIFRKRIDTIRI